MSPGPDDTARWRAEIINEFRLRGEERCAAASPGPGFPQLFETTLHSLRSAPPGPLLDVGGGLGGVASWLQRRSGHPVLTLDTAVSALHSARLLFAELDVLAGDAQALPVAHAAVSAVILSGVISLGAQADVMLAEAHRVLAPDGFLVVADLWSASSSSYATPANHFWSVEEFRTIGAQTGFTLHEVGLCDTTRGWWSTAGDDVDAEMGARYCDRREWQRYQADREYLRREMRSGRLLAAVVTLTRAADGVTPVLDGNGLDGNALDGSVDA